MILGNDREAVIENIRYAAENRNFYAKVELSDPVLSDREKKAVTDRYLKRRKGMPYRAKRFFARRIADFATKRINRDTEIVGEELLPDLDRGVILTSNHFGPLENTVIRHLLAIHGKKRLNVVSQVTNFAMTGPIGFLMNYADTVPLGEEARYLARDLVTILGEKLDMGESVLIYPEQEMWFNYRKPRPPKPGAYHFAAKLNAPVVSCFVEMIDLPEMDTEEFYRVKYRLHVLGTIYPDPDASLRENTARLAEADYALKRAAYERIYGVPLTYDFAPTDIAGWHRSYEA
ncbi:MAG: 1-acyl-sn-glycerol-3-phosphate acyltransferase [Clostridia bacterium]|nr:1-acyl-sn-glycerol-3-phosphate acyltransferase [Clostridia bacterium]